MGETPGLPVASAAGFRSNTIIAAVLETAATGNRIVITYVPATSISQIRFYTGLEPATDSSPAIIQSQDAGGFPVLDISGGGYETADPRPRRTYLGRSADATHPNSAVEDITDQLFGIQTTPGDGQSGLVPMVRQLAGYAGSGGLTYGLFATWPQICGGEFVGATDGSGEVTIPIGPFTNGTGPVMPQLIGGAVATLQRTAQTTSSVTYQLKDTATQAPLGSGVTVVIEWVAFGW